MTQPADLALCVEFAKILGRDNVRQGFFGQEINLTTKSLPHQYVPPRQLLEVQIAHGDTRLIQAWDDEPFEAIVSNPPIQSNGRETVTLLTTTPFRSSRSAGTQEQSRPRFYHAHALLACCQRYGGNS